MLVLAELLGVTASLLLSFPGRRVWEESKGQERLEKERPRGPEGQP